MKKTGGRWFRGAAAVVVLGVVALSGLAAVIQAEGKQARAPKTGKELYLAACAACHGADGTGAPQSQLGFDLEMPDFTDCGFASREPDDDWLAVAHSGGPTRRFSKFMPAFGEALSMEELKRIIAHVRSLCDDRNWPRGELNLPRALVTEKAFPEDEALFTTAVAAQGRGSVMNKMIYEQRVGARNQIELVIPFGWQERLPGAEGWSSDLGDVAVGAKRAVFHSLESGSIFSIAGEILLPTGDHQSGIGKGTTILEPFVAFGQILPADFFLQSQSGVELPLNTDRAPREAFWRFVLGRTFEPRQFGRAWSPMVELLGSRAFLDGHRNQWDVVPQVQVTLSRRQHIMANVGVRIPVTDSGPRDTQLLFYLLWDWFDGGLFEGW
jgi:mono/diheme cytochrome c family protein